MDYRERFFRRMDYIQEVVNSLYSLEYVSPYSKNKDQNVRKDEEKHKNDTNVRKFLGDKELGFENFDRDMREEVKNFFLEKTYIDKGFKMKGFKNYINKKYGTNFNGKKLLRSFKRIGLTHDGKKWRIK